MSKRLRGKNIVVALGVIAALAIVTPAFGISSSIKKAIKKEVSKQISNATGPAGQPGLPGTNGLDGTARAYAELDPATCTGTPGTCSIARSKGVSSITRLNLDGYYCVTASGIDAANVSPAVTVDLDKTTGSFVGLFAVYDGTCDGTSPGAGSKFLVVTRRQDSTTVCKTVSGGTCTATANVAGVAQDVNDVGFTIVIP
jgi:hypothetical protein